MAIALPVMMARPRPRFRGRAGGGGDAGAVGGAGFGGARWGGGGGVSCAAGFGRRGSALVPWSCAFSRPACPSLQDGRYLLPAGRLLLRAGLVFVGVILPLFPLLRWGPLRGDQLRASRRGGGGPGLGSGVRLPLGLLRHLARPGWGDGRSWLGGSLLRPGGQQSGGRLRPCCVRGRLVRLLVSRTRRGRGAGRSAGGADAWACALSRAARMRCRSESDSTGRVNGPVPGPRFVPGARRGRGGPPLSSATPTPLAACTTARSLQDRGAQNGLPINTNRSTNDQ